MRSRRAGFRVFTLLSGALGVSMLFALSGVAAVGDETSGGLDRFAPIDPSVYAPDGANSTFVPASLSDQPVEVVLQMSGDPVAVQDAAAQQSLGRKLTGAEKQAIRDQLQAQQDGLRGDLDRAGAQVVGQMQDAYNGVHVIVPESNLDQLASLPGVVAVHGVTTFTPDNTNGVPFIGGPTAWGFGATGKGVKVASIDTGIDYTHADFGGPGTVDAFIKAKANSTQPADPSLFGPAAPKVKGGFDFAGDAYNASDPNHRVPVQDPNPLDCNGHGSHTAGTMAGFGVLSTGATFAGPYDANTVKNNSWNVGPGVAPQADIYAYRVFGCTGSSAVVDLAINRAVKDGVDVISMSLGSPFGGTTDATSVAAQNAFDDGITVVASAGNSGPNGYLVGSPSTATGVLSVAAIDGSVASYPGASLALSTGATVKAIDANGAPISAVTLPVKVLRNADGTVSLGCNPAEYLGSTGKLVVTTRGTCARVSRAIFGQQAGAAAVLMINSAAGLPPFEGKITSNPDTGAPFVVTIPFLGAGSGATAALVAADGGTATLSSTTVPNSNYKLPASFTSGGPRSGDSAPKPDVMAPGVSVSSVGMGTGTQPTVMSGTSMACPMTAGIAALVKQMHPTWHGAQIKAAIINTADPSILAGVSYNVRIAGTGVVQAQKAVNSSVVASTTDGLDSIAFGYVQGTGDYNASKAFTLTNYGSTSATYLLSVATNGTQRGESVTVSPSSVTVAAGATQTVNVSLSITSDTFAALPTDDILATNALGQFISGPGVVLTVRGNIVATPVATDAASDQTLRLAYVIVARGLSAVTPGAVGAFSNVSSVSSTHAGTPGHTIAANLPLSNPGIHTGTADLYAWGIHHDQTTGSAIDVRDVGLKVLQGGSKVPNDRALIFAISNYGSASNQAKNEFDVVIFNNGDTKPDFVVAGADIGAVLTGASDGRYGSFTIDLHTHKIVAAFLADAPMNGSVIELRTQASALGLAQKATGVGDVKNEGITYRVNAFDLRTGAVVRTGSTTFNPFSPSVSSGDLATLAPGGGTSFTLAVDTDQQFAQPALGWLVASLDNASGPAQASEIAAPQS